MHSPLLGFNNNVKHRGRVFHIQTEDSGVKHPHVITHLFADGGRILNTKKTSYAQHIEDEHLADLVRDMMKQQHRAMFIALREGQFDHLLSFDDAAGPSPSGSRSSSSISASAASAVASAAEATPRGAAAASAKKAGEPASPPAKRPPPPPPAASPAASPAGASSAVAAALPSPLLPSQQAALLDAPSAAAVPAAAAAKGKSRGKTPSVAPPARVRSPVEVARPSALAGGAPALPLAAAATKGAVGVVASVASVASAPAAVAPAGPTTARMVPAGPGPRSVSDPSREKKAPASARFVASRPATGANPLTEPGRSIFGEDLISEKSLDEVILSYLSEDLDGAAGSQK